MDIRKLESKLFEAARINPLDESVPFAFENRVMARLSGLQSSSVSGLLDSFLWKAAFICAVVAMLSGAWALQPMAERTPVSLESTVLSMAKQLGETW